MSIPSEREPSNNAISGASQIEVIVTSKKEQPMTLDIRRELSKTDLAASEIKKSSKKSEILFFIPRKIISAAVESKDALVSFVTFIINRFRRSSEKIENKVSTEKWLPERELARSEDELRKAMSEGGNEGISTEKPERELARDEKTLKEALQEMQRSEELPPATNLGSVPVPAEVRDEQLADFSKLASTLGNDSLLVRKDENGNKKFVKTYEVIPEGEKETTRDEELITELEALSAHAQRDEEKAVLFAGALANFIVSTDGTEFIRRNIRLDKDASRLEKLWEEHKDQISFVSPELKERAEKVVAEAKLKDVQVNIFKLTESILPQMGDDRFVYNIEDNSLKIDPRENPKKNTQTEMDKIKREDEETAEYLALLSEAVHATNDQRIIEKFSKQVEMLAQKPWGKKLLIQVSEKIKILREAPKKKQLQEEGWIINP